MMDEKDVMLQKITAEDALEDLKKYYDCDNIYELTLSEIKEYLINVLNRE